MATNILQSFLGGGLIGLASVILLVGNGRIAGISGIYNGILQYYKGSLGWRIYFILGLGLGGYLFSIIMPEAFESISVTASTPLRSPLQIALAGILVGFGTVMGTGCTSGHGICGNSRGAPRSLASTAIFMIVGIITATFLIPLINR